MPNIETNEDLQLAQAYLSFLLEEDPTLAIAEVRQLRGKGPAWLPTQTLRAGTLVDGGGITNDRLAVREGIKILRKLTSKTPNDLVIRYNLANGLSELAALESYSGPEWYPTTHPQRKEARRLYNEVAKNEAASAELQAQALINLGNGLDSGYRWVEAYDCWVQALAVDPTNTVAALSIARMLLRRIREPVLHHLANTKVAGYYARLAAKQYSQIERFAGRKAAKMAQSLPEFRSSWKPRPLYRLKDDFARFVATYRLALVGTVEGLDLRKKRWDDVDIPPIRVSLLDARHGVSPIFAMFNQLKADFCTARWLAYISQEDISRDTSLYRDTLDYATYGMRPSMLILAQRAALDILDRIAVCVSNYLGIGEKPNEVHFRTFWRDNEGTGAWRAYLQAELSEGNPGIIALGELASDLCEGGFLWSKRDLRNISTHRFCVLHDLGDLPSRPNPAIEHFNIRSFFDQTIESLQVVRSAILYLLETVMWHEARRQHNGPVVTLIVPPHHYIRGED